MSRKKEIERDRERETEKYKNIEGENSQLSCKGGSREQDRQKERE